MSAISISTIDDHRLPAGNGLSELHVLLADTDAACCERVAEYLGRHDIRVSIVGSVTQVLQSLASESIDLLLLEPKSHGKDGLLMTRTTDDARRPRPHSGDLGSCDSR